MAQPRRVGGLLSEQVVEIDGESLGDHPNLFKPGEYD
jgi:hypothetical protein